ncbi:hypothetical protein [Jiangella rhizosphaerae]|uniref:Uncharacterized protein n=1 Tax=Jiangella rhizosphaerae TaxID=2293569 RepID=A0A418KPN9_9ACTN|nr:hypothetical protein [Jiangella rhizosphaerae]RIQ21267.1 hypothetical protein DY240_15710 [Jiangella rhizosphaerae]
MTKVEEAQPKRYRVTAPYVTVKAEVGGFLAGAGSNGYGVVGVYKDGILPPSAVPEAVESLLARGLVEEVAP